MDHVHVVLIEPKESRNIGAVARAMQNLGFSHLHLVAPRGYDREQAGVTARGAEVLLDQARIHTDFTDAIADMEEVVGLALREGANPAHYVTLPQWAQGGASRPQRRTALVFGPEDDDLRLEHLAHCRWVVRIPSSAAFPSFNLAQSVLLTLYELTRREPESGAEPAALPTQREWFHLDRHVDAVMAASGFVRPGSPEPIPRLVKNLFRRLDLTPHELRVLLALFSRVRTQLDRTTPDGYPSPADASNFDPS